MSESSGQRNVPEFELLSACFVTGIITPYELTGALQSFPKKEVKGRHLLWIALVRSLTVLCPVWTTVAFGPFVVSFRSIPFTYCSAASCLTATSCVYCQSFKFTSKLIFYSLYASLRGAEGNMPRHFIRILLVLFCLENCNNSPFHRFSKVQNNSWDLAPYWHDSIT